MGIAISGFGLLVVLSIHTMEQNGLREERRSALLLADVGTGPDEGGFYPIGLKCPAENGGVVEQLRLASDGKTLKYLLEYRNGEPYYVSWLYAEDGSKFRPFKDLARSELTSEGLTKLFRYWVRIGETLVQEICNGQARDRDAYLQALQENYKRLTESKSD